MTKFLAWLVLFSTLVFARGAGFVGNGGGGIEIDGSLYVWDLFSLGLHQNSYIGPKTDPHLPPLPSDQAISFSYPKALLARKLTDLNQIAPGMGDFVLASMKRYTWSLEDFPLKPISDPDDDPLLIPPGARLVQIANRLNTTIRIHASSWARLDDANKVALLIHEAVFSLVKPGRGVDGIMHQSPRVAREITAAFFSPSYYAKNPSWVYAGLKEELAIPAEMLPLRTLRQPPSWAFAYGPNPGLLPNKLRFQFTPSSTYDSLLRFLTTACRKTGLLAKAQPSDTYMVSSFSPKKIEILVSQYAVPEGFQSYIQISNQEFGPSERDYSFDSVEGCLTHYADLLVRIAKSL